MLQVTADIGKGTLPCLSRGIDADVEGGGSCHIIEDLQQVCVCCGVLMLAGARRSCWQPVSPLQRLQRGEIAIDFSTDVADIATLRHAILYSTRRKYKHRDACIAFMKSLLEATPVKSEHACLCRFCGRAENFGFWR